MKKFLSLILALTMILALAACGSTGGDAAEDSDAPVTGEVEGDVIEGEEGTEDTEGAEDAEGTEDTEQPAGDADKPVESKPENKPVEDKPAQDGQGSSASSDSIAGALKTQFESIAADKDALAIAEALLTNEKIQFAGVSMPVEPGLLNGFGNEEITGFQEAAIFAPMIGSIPFVGYIFTLADGADVNAFMDSLKANSNPGWNVCVIADETVVSSVGNKVFFCMAPFAIEG